MNKQQYTERKKAIDTLAAKYGWQKTGDDSATGRLSYTDDVRAFRIDLYSTRLTICIVAATYKPVYLKNLSLQGVERIFKNPYQIKFKA